MKFNCYVRARARSREASIDREVQLGQRRGRPIVFDINTCTRNTGDTKSGKVVRRGNEPRPGRGDVPVLRKVKIVSLKSATARDVAQESAPKPTETALRIACT